MKRITLLSLAVPVLAIVLWLALSPKRNPTQTAPSTPAHPKLVSREPKVKREEIPVSRVDSMQENQLLAEHAARLSRIMTPQKKIAMVEQLLEMKKPFYEELFSAWKLDKYTIERTWDQLIRRETYHLALNANMYEAMSKAATSDVSKVASAGQKKVNNGKEYDDLDLIAILGPGRFEELKAVDQRVKSRLLNMNAIDD